MTDANIHPVLERQLLLQLGDRLKRLRKAQGLGTVEMAARCGMTRNTLRSVESGDPSPSMGAYLRVMSVLGISGELALLAGDTLQPPPADSAAAGAGNGPTVAGQWRLTFRASVARVAIHTWRRRLAQGAGAYPACAAIASDLTLGYRLAARCAHAHPPGSPRVEERH